MLAACAAVLLAALIVLAVDSLIAVAEAHAIGIF